MLFRYFLPRSKRLLISWLQSPSSVILEPKKILTLQMGNLRPRPSCHKATTRSSHRGTQVPLFANVPLTHPWAQVSVLRRCCKPQLRTVFERPPNPNWIYPCGPRAGGATCRGVWSSHWGPWSGRWNIGTFGMTHWVF